MRIGFRAMALVAGLAVGAPALAQTGQGHSHSDQGHSDQGHAHHHNHDDQAAGQVHKGFFDDAQVADRALSDYAGEWQSVYPLLQDGTLDQVMAKKARKGDKTAEEYRDYYMTGYETDVDRIVINGDSVSFHRGDRVVSGEYAADGYEILTYKAGNRGVRFVFEKTAGDADAPQFLQFSDHRIAPAKADHYHLYWGNDRAALLTQLTNWPTYYPAGLSGAEIVAEMMAH